MCLCVCVYMYINAVSDYQNGNFCIYGYAVSGRQNGNPFFFVENFYMSRWVSVGTFFLLPFVCVKSRCLQ